MIERLLAAEKAIEDGDLEVAERLFRQVSDADPRNAIAIVGLARVAHGRDQPEAARRFVEDALAIDPDEALARRLRAELAPPAEVPAAALVSPEAAAREPAPAAEPPPAPEPGPAAKPGPAPEPRPAPELAPAPTAEPSPSPTEPRRRGGVMGWLRRLLRLDR